MKYGIKTIEDFDVKGKTILLRVDINLPVDKKARKLMDTTRIEACIPTIKELSEKGAKLVIIAHQGSDIEYKNYYNLLPHSKIMSKLMDKEVRFVPDICGLHALSQIENLKDGEILLLDNVRFMAEEMTLFETKLDLTTEQIVETQVVKKLSPLADIFIVDAFASAHRKQPSLVGFSYVLPSGMGRLFEKEYAILSRIFETPKSPCIFVLGGAKVQDAFMVMEKVLKDGIADRILTGGLLGNIMLIASRIDIGKKSEEFIYKRNLGEFIEEAEEILYKYKNRIVIPDDLAYIEGKRIEIPVVDLLPDKMYVDIGEKTINKYSDIIGQAETIFVNGPMGVYEKKETELGTRAVLKAIADSKGYSVVGGGDSVAAVNKFEVRDKIDYICTGGGALIRFLSHEELPVIKALKEANN